MAYDLLNYNEYLRAKQNFPNHLIIMRSGLIPRDYYYDPKKNGLVYFYPIRVPRYVVCDEASEIVRRRFPMYNPIKFYGHVWYAFSCFELWDMDDAFKDSRQMYVYVDGSTGLEISEEEWMNDIFSSQRLIVEKERR